MHGVLRGVDLIARVANALGAVLIALIFLFMFSEVVARLVFNRSLGISWELSTYFMTALIFLGAANTLRTGGHVRVSLLLEVLGPRIGRGIDLLATAVGLAIIVFLAMAATELAYQSYERGVRSFQPSRAPLWVPQSAIAIGLILLGLQAMARLVRLLLGEPPEAESPEVREPHAPKGGAEL